MKQDSNDEQALVLADICELITAGTLCAILEAALLRSQADSEKLMEAVVGKMLAGDDEARRNKHWKPLDSSLFNETKKQVSEHFL